MGINHTYMSHPLSHSELLRIIEEYLSSDLIKYATDKKCGLYQGRITYWLRILGVEDKPYTVCFAVDSYLVCKQTLSAFVL